MFSQCEVLLELGPDARELVVELGAKAMDDRNDRDEIPAAIRPYSMAVAPDSFFKRADILVILNSIQFEDW